MAVDKPGGAWGVVAFIILLAAFAWVVFVPRGTVQLPEWGFPAGRYENAVHGFAFSVPSAFSAQEFTPDYISVGTTTAQGFQSFADIAVARGGERGEEYESFVRDRIEALCAASGPASSLDCIAIERASAFRTREGARGAEYYLRLRTRALSTGDAAEASYGPVYAFALSADESDARHVVLLIYPPLGAYFSGASPSAVRAVADSLALPPSAP